MPLALACEPHRPRGRPVACPVVKGRPVIKASPQPSLVDAGQLHDLSQPGFGTVGRLGVALGLGDLGPVSDFKTRRADGR